MQFTTPLTIDWLVNFLSAIVLGNEKNLAQGINEIHKVEEGDICFVDHPKYYEKCINSNATIIIINTKDVSFPKEKTLLVVDEPFEAYLKIVQHFRAFTAQQSSVHENLIIGENTVIQPNVFIGKNVSIGKNCIIHPNVSILDYSVIGDNCIIQSGTVIGSDAFYYNTKKNREVWYKKMLSCGRVVIEDDVEIGASCTIDRGVTHDTVIGRGTKFDNLVHIGHDSVIGKNCLFAAQVGVAGAVDIKDGVVLWGQVGVSKTLTIGENAVVLAQSGVPSSLEANKVYFGYPAEDASYKRREIVWIKRIPEMWEKLKSIKP